MIQLDPASKAQQIATDPLKSTWLSANAGSGKTRVLTDRVALLLLEGTKPQNILCLTYTKAAASEMQNRLFKRLGEWAMLDNANLRGELAKLGVSDIQNENKLKRARTLFAAAIETPGGLRIQTIHSFCASLLRRFPLEARVPPQFRELDDRNADLLESDILAAMAKSADKSILDQISQIISENDFGKIGGFIKDNRHRFANEMTLAEYRERFGISAENTLTEASRRFFSNSTVAKIGALADAMAGGSKTDDDHSKNLRAVNLTSPGAADRAALYKILLKFTENGPEPKTTRFGTTDTRKAHPEAFEEITPLMEELATLWWIECAETTAINSHTLHQFARAYLRRYTELKALHGWLDFDDLISRTADLLTDATVAQWVMYRIDGGIDHILVDEAQDTSPAQWRVIQLLAQDFGLDAEDGRQRTLFVVGDKKQSIYSFQGADPAEFDRMCAFFDDRLSQVNQVLHPRELQYSFRSSPAILNVVDQVFNQIDRGGFDRATHRAFHEKAPGRVDVWPIVPEPDKPEKKDWFDASPIIRPTDEKAALARLIASGIRQMVDEEFILDQDGLARPVDPGDILVLVQRRKELFREIIQACKREGLPVAGADRLRVAEELAVKDLLAVISFLALPDDDLSLAAVLRSPLFGLSEQDLFSLAHNRGEITLWSALNRNKDKHPDTVDVLTDLRNKADYLPPYELLERLLSRWDGRAKLVSRLGGEAEECIVEFLNLARDYDREEPASLTGFLSWFSRDDTEIKRQVEAGGGKIRIMTTHGAKGLEAPIVILPETQQAQDKPQPGGYVDQDGNPFWRVSKEFETPQQENASAYARIKNEEERWRLLYVAMTRAEKWLIVCGAGKDPAKEGSWYKRVEFAVAGLGSTEIQRDFGAVHRYEFGDWPQSANIAQQPSQQPAGTGLPNWATELPANVAKAPKHLNPSDTEKSKSLPGAEDTSELSAARGTAIHALLENAHLFEGRDFSEVALEILASRGLMNGDLSLDHLLPPVKRILENPDLQFIFGTNSAVEVPFSVPISNDDYDYVAGLIDRMVIEDDRILIIDYKSNQIIPENPADTPPGILDQLASYAFAISKIYPNHRVDTAILWVNSSELMEIPHKIVNEHALALNLS